MAPLSARPVVVALSALLFLAPFVMLPGGFEPANLPQTAVVELGALALVLLALWRASDAAPSWPPGPFALPAAALGAWSLFSLVWAVNVREGLLTWVHWAACSLVGLVVLWTARPEDARTLLSAVFWSGAAAGALGLGQYLFAWKWVPQAFPPAATFMNRNVAVSFVVVCLPLAAAAWREGRRGLQWSVALAAAVMTAFLFHTFTKSGWIALGAEATILAWIVLARRRRGAGVSVPAAVRVPAFVAALLLLVLIHLTPGGLQPRLLEAARAVGTTWQTATILGQDRPLAQLSEDDRSNSIRVRRAIWLNTLAMVADHPLGGVGLGNHKVAYPLYWRRLAVDPGFSEKAQLDWAHNDFLQVLAELGVIGAGLLAWLLVTLVRVLGAGLRSEPLPVATAAMAVALAGLLADACFNFPFQRALPPLVFAVLLGLLSVLHAPPRRSPLARRARAPLALAAVLALVPVGVAQVRLLAADRHVDAARRAEARGDWTRAADESAAALRWDPTRREALFTGGTAALVLGRPDDAATRLGTLLVGYPNDGNALGNLALARTALGQPEQALAAYERLARIVPDDPRVQRARGAAQFRAGLAALRAGRKAEAVAALREAVRLQPERADAHKALGIALLDMPEAREEAREHLRRALDLDPAIADAARMRAILDRP